MLAVTGITNRYEGKARVFTIPSIQLFIQLYKLSALSYFRIGSPICGTCILQYSDADLQALGT